MSKNAQPVRASDNPRSATAILTRWLDPHGDCDRIGGLLWLFAACLAVVIATNAIGAGQLAWHFFEGDVFMAQVEDPGAQGLFVFEFLASALLTIYGLVMVPLFFSRNRRFKWVAVGLFGINIACVATDTLWNLQVFDDEGWNIVGPSIDTLVCVVWIVYFLVSRRVKKTFVV